MSKTVIDYKALCEIKALAITEFNKIQTLGDLNSVETMQLLVLKGLEMYLHNVGQDVTFTVRVKGVLSAGD